MNPVERALQLRASGQLDGAIAALRAILAADPNDARARLELALALEQAGNLVAARYHLELVLGADLPPDLLARALADLRRIRERSTTGSLSIATLSPVKSRLVVEPDGSARTVDGEGSYGAGIAASGRLAFGATGAGFVRGSIDYRDYGGRLDDFLYSQGTLGRVFPTESTTYSVEAGGLASAYQDRFWYRGGLLQASATTYFGPALTWFNTLLTRRLDYDKLKGATANQGYFFSDLRWAAPASLTYGIGATAGVSRADERWRGFKLGELRASVLRELPRGVIIEARLAGSYARYDAIEPGFTTTRSDLSGLVGLDLTLREWAIFGLAPRLSVARRQIESNQTAYDSGQTFFGVGLTSSY